VPRILLTQSIHPLAQARLARLAEVLVAPDTSADTLRRCAKGCAAIVVRAPLPEDLFDAAPSLLGAVRHGAGVDMIPIAAATAHGVLVANVPGVNAGSVAEHVVWSMLHLARQRTAMEVQVRRFGDAGWARARALADTGFELAGRSLGLIGYGHVGRCIARLCAQGLGMHVLAHTRSQRGDDAAGAQRVPLPDLLQRSDFVVLACPLTEQTRGLIGAPELALMRPGAFLINVARGPVVEEGALIEALQAGRLAGAALDVFDVQPLPAAHPYRHLQQVLLTPHVAGITQDSMLRMGYAAAQAVEQLLQGTVPGNCLNPEAETAFRGRFAQRLGEAQ
jgi:D-3-phosphoglycerate dehydrogenase / 2-oxoglutarate reductase